MADYKLVKHCRLCKARFVVDRGQARVIYCTKCQKKVHGESQKQTRAKVKKS